MYKTICTFMIAAFACITMGWTGIHPSAPNEYDFFAALRQVESNDGKKLLGDFDETSKTYKSIGPYQIQWAYYRDSGVGGEYSDCLDRQFSERVMRGYWNRYAKGSLAKGEWEKLAKIHNSGPNGDKKSVSDAYWNKVKGRMGIK